MLDICSNEAEQLHFSFNTVKSVALRIGPRYKHNCAPLVLSDSKLAHVEQTKYLGVVLKSGISFECVLDHVKTKFYPSVNAILYRAKNAGSAELVCVCAIVEICVSTCIYYAVEVLPLTKTDMSMLDHLVDRVFYRTFGCTSSADIQFLRSVLDLPGLSVCINERQVRLVSSFSRSFSCAAMLSCAVHC